MALKNSICVLIIIGLLVLTNAAEANFLCRFLIGGVTTGVTSLAGSPLLASAATGVVSSLADKICAGADLSKPDIRGLLTCKNDDEAHTVEWILPLYDMGRWDRDSEGQCGRDQSDTLFGFTNWHPDKPNLFDPMHV
uniref:Uncharacterized protein n=1 Tax=Magallana gigas TaxID=29159 RepID=K1QTC6_MAGGI